MHQVHLQQPCLQWAFGGPVVLESIQQEGSALLDQVILHEHINNLKRNQNMHQFTELLRQ